jgi:hypothetical protein
MEQEWNTDYTDNHRLNNEPARLKSFQISDDWFAVRRVSDTGRRMFAGNQDPYYFFSILIFKAINNKGLHFLVELSQTLLTDEHQYV